MREGMLVKDDEWRETTYRKGQLVQSFCRQPVLKTFTGPHQFSSTANRLPREDMFVLRRQRRARLMEGKV